MDFDFRLLATFGSYMDFDVPNFWADTSSLKVLKSRQSCHKGASTRLLFVPFFLWIFIVTLCIVMHPTLYFPPFPIGNSHFMSSFIFNSLFHKSRITLPNAEKATKTTAWTKTKFLTETKDTMKKTDTNTNTMKKINTKTNTIKKLNTACLFHQSRISLTIAKKSHWHLKRPRQWQRQMQTQ